MKLLKKDLRGNEGEISLIVESLDDMWHLKYILEPQDIVFADTKRRIEGATDKLRPEKADKKTMRIGICVEKVEFHKFANRLRVHGTIVDGIDIGAYHTINIEAGTDISIIKKWKSDQFERIKEAQIASMRPNVIIATIEEGEASIGMVRQFGVEDTTSIGISGFQEVLRRGAVDRIMEESRIGREAKLIEELMKEISINGKVSYGMADARNAQNLGAIHTLLITDELLRTEREGKSIDELLKEVEHSQGRIVVFSTEFEPGKKLESLGGIAALLRFRVNP